MTDIEAIVTRWGWSVLVLWVLAALVVVTR
jgi:hypothetical protein